jgi:glycosyltransferase involved in cell wall biosynthesis
LPKRRLIFDISTLARSGGHADGTVRTARALASWAFFRRKDITFVIYDTQVATLRTVREEWLARILDGSAKVDTSPLPDPWSAKCRLRTRLPQHLRNLVRWIQRPRRQAFVTLEGWRLRTTSKFWIARIRRVQDALISDKYRVELSDADGGRRALIPYEMAIGPSPEVHPDDVLVLAGSDWGTIYLQRLGTVAPKIVVLCYDTIPLLFPQFYPEKTVRGFREYFHRLFTIADLVVFTAKQVESDSRRYCEANGLALKKTRIISLGADFNRVDSRSSTSLPVGLQSGRYALFVSTIEPRKGHRLLFSVWQRLLAEGVPQATGFKLVFVGRRGWLVDDLLKELDQHPAVGDSLFVLSNVGDHALAALYSHAAFCLFPSLYEGYGLPIIEGFRYGKAVLASSAGALAEVVGEFSPCLDPRDEQAWYTMLKRWIQEPAARASFEQAIRERFRPPTWDDAARSFFGLIEQDLA